MRIQNLAPTQFPSGGGCAQNWVNLLTNSCVRLSPINISGMSAATPKAMPLLCDDSYRWWATARVRRQSNPAHRSVALLPGQGPGRTANDRTARHSRRRHHCRLVFCPSGPCPIAVLRIRGHGRICAMRPCPALPAARPLPCVQAPRAAAHRTPSEQQFVYVCLRISACARISRSICSCSTEIYD